MKGIVFAGCSFTWGQGLYYYSKLETLKEPAPDTYDSNLVTDAHRRYMATLRYPRLVANHFNTFEVVSYVNSGSEQTSVDFLNKVFNLTEGFEHIMNEKFSYSEIEYIVIQTSQSNRNLYKYVDKNGEEKTFHIYQPDTKPSFYEWLIEDKKWSFDDWYNDHRRKVLDNVKKVMNFFESKGIKTIMLCWEDEYLYIIKEDEWFLERFVPLYYKDKKYECIRHLMNENRYLTINGDYDNFENPPKDHHPSMECHKIIADNVIKKIEDNIINDIYINQEYTENDNYTKRII